MNTRASQSKNELAGLRARQSTLLRRLVDGDKQITVAKHDGIDTSHWEDHWIVLLREYETVCRALGERAPEQYPAAA